MSAEATWYLGPLGDMRPLVVPAPGVVIDDIRFGGIHQGLSGARTMDITGHRTEYELQINYMCQEEFIWLEALHSRLVPGPFRLLDPLKRNRLTRQASRLMPFEFRNSGVYCSAPYEMVRDAPLELDTYSRAMAVSDWVTDNAFIQFDQSKPVPFLASETLTASVYLRAAAATSAVLRMSWYDVDQVYISNTDTPIGITTTWERHWMTYPEPPQGAVAGTMTVVLGAALDNTVSVIAPQIEVDVDEPSPWVMGGAAPVVLIDQMPINSKRYPLRNVTLKLLEV